MGSLLRGPWHSEETVENSHQHFDTMVWGAREADLIFQRHPPTPPFPQTLSRLTLGLCSLSACKLSSKALLTQWSMVFTYGQDSLSATTGEEVLFISKRHFRTSHFSLIMAVRFSGSYQKSSSLTLIIFQIHWLHCRLAMAGASECSLRELINKGVEGLGSFSSPPLTSGKWISDPTNQRQERYKVSFQDTRKPPPRSNQGCGTWFGLHCLSNQVVMSTTSHQKANRSSYHIICN